MKINSDEREADRLTQRLIRLDDQNLRLQEEFTKLTGSLKKVKALEADPNYQGTGDGSASIAAQQSKIAMDRESLKTRINEALDQRSSILGGLATYYEGYNRLAPDLFERFKNAGKDKTLTGISGIDADEMPMVVEDLRKQGIEVTDELMAGLQRGFQDKKNQTFDQEAKEEELRLRNLLLKMRMNAANKEKQGKDLAAKQKMEELRTRIMSLNNMSKNFEIDGAIPGVVPLASQTTFGDIAQSLANIVANFVSRGDKVDKGDPFFGFFATTPEVVRDAISEWKNATGDAKNRAALDLASLISSNSSYVMGFDYTGTDLYGRSNEHASGEPQFLGEAISIFGSIMQFESDRFFHSPEGKVMLDALDMEGQQAAGVGKETSPASSSSPSVESTSPVSDKFKSFGIQLFDDLINTAQTWTDEANRRKELKKGEDLLHVKALKFLDDISMNPR